MNIEINVLELIDELMRNGMAEDESYIAAAYEYHNDEEE